MKNFVEYLLVRLVDPPEDLVVEEEQTAEGHVIHVRVHADDMGRVICKGGKVANSIRALLRVAAEREGKQATLDVVEPE